MEKCVPFNSNLTLPSRCYLVKVNVSTKLYNILIREASNLTYSSLSNRTKDFTINDTSINNNPQDRNDTDSESNDLEMDLLPESYRFTSDVSIRLASNIFEDLLNDDVNDNNDDEENDDYDDNEENKYGNALTMYVQTNSRLKLITLSANSDDEQFQIDNTIRVVSCV